MALSNTSSVLALSKTTFGLDLNKTLPN
jgi:hypothetical protein